MSGRRGDLGFIRNNNGYTANRGFVGSPGHPSRKGVVGPGQLSRLQHTQERTESNTMTMGNSLSNEISGLPAKIEETYVSKIADATVGTSMKDVASDPMLSRRYEYLELQNRKLTATLNETRSEYSALKSRFEEQANKVGESLSIFSKFRNKAWQSTKALFDELQWVYGKTGHTLYGIECTENSLGDIEVYKKRLGNVPMGEIAKANEWVYLLYPMERVDISDAHTQYLMRSKMVNKKTGQLKLCWCVVYETINGAEKRFINSFSLLPEK